MTVHGSELRLCEGLKKKLAVGVIEKNLLPSITPTGEMINRTGKLQPKWPCHAERAAAHLLNWNCNT
jgi:hypothetical protein